MELFKTLQFLSSVADIHYNLLKIRKDASYKMCKMPYAYSDDQDWEFGAIFLIKIVGIGISLGPV